MKARFLSAAALAACIFAAAPASAAVVTFQGVTQGCFGASCTPSGLGATDSDLLFTDGHFNQSTDATGFLGLGGASDNLGTFSLGGVAHTFTGDLFTLLVSFTLPAGSGSGTFEALLHGSVTSGTAGSVFVDFDNTPQLISSDSGQFTLQVNDVSVSSNGLAQILSGQIQAVPEPATWAMMLLGFGGIGMAMRGRRRRPALAQIA